MRISLRLMGLDVLDLNVETASELEGAPDSMTYPVPFSPPAEEFQVPDRGWGE